MLSTNINNTILKAIAINEPRIMGNYDGRCQKFPYFVGNP